MARLACPSPTPSSTTGGLGRLQLLSASWNVCLVRRTPLFRWLQTVGCQVSLSWPSHTVSLISFSTSFQSFFHIDAFLDSAACMLACRSGYFLPSGNNPPSLKVVLVMSDIILFTSSDVRLRCWLWCKTSVFICCGQLFPVGSRARRHLCEGSVSVSKALAALIRPLI